MPQSEACRRGDHEDCGGNGDMLGCTCDCHEESEPPDGPLLVNWPTDAEWHRAWQLEMAEKDYRNER